MRLYPFPKNKPERGSVAFDVGKLVVSVSTVFDSGPHTAVFDGDRCLKEFSGHDAETVVKAIRYAKRRDAHRHRWLHDWVKPTRPTDYGERLTVALSVLVMLYTLAQLIRWAL